MAFPRKRAGGSHKRVLKWTGKAYINAGGTKDRSEEEQIRQGVENRLVRIRRGENTLASKLLLLQIVCSTGIRRVQLVRLRPSDYVKGPMTTPSKRAARQQGLSEISLNSELTRCWPRPTGILPFGRS